MPSYAAWRDNWYCAGRTLPSHVASVAPSIEPVAVMTTLVEALSRMNVDQLKPLVAWLGEVSPKGRKDELIGGIVRSLSASGLRLLWSGLDELQRLAVAEALYDADGVFHSDRRRTPEE